VPDPGQLRRQDQIIVSILQIATTTHHEISARSKMFG
jgi:hypothetical protein